MSLDNACLLDRLRKLEAYLGKPYERPWYLLDLERVFPVHCMQPNRYPEQALVAAPCRPAGNACCAVKPRQFLFSEQWSVSQRRRGTTNQRLPVPPLLLERKTPPNCNRDGLSSCQSKFLGSRTTHLVDPVVYVICNW